MNKVETLPPQDFAGRIEGERPLRRPPPRSVKLLLPVWGYNYVRQFLECGLPTLLAPGNVPALAEALPTEFIIMTGADDEEFIQEHASFKRLSAICRTEVRLIDHLITDGNYSTTITLAYTEAVRSVGEAMVDTCFFFLVSDYVVADGSFANVLKRMMRGASAVIVGNFQIAMEEALPWLQFRLGPSRRTLALPPRELMQWALNHLHPATLANIINIPFSHNSHTNRLFWRVDGSTILGRFYLMHMLCVRPELTDFTIEASCDYSFVPEMCPSGNVEAVTDSDEYLVIEMQPRDHEAQFLRHGPLKPQVLASSLNEWTTKMHRENARHSVIFHAGELPQNLDASIAKADTFVSRVARHLRRRPLPHRSHPYWRGAIAAFSDATGRRIKEDQWRYVLGLPTKQNWLTDWVLWRAKYVFTGRPPYVLPWHPTWPDFRKVLQELKPFFRDPNERLLLLSNEPTPFTLALADGGERVDRLRCSPFLQSRPERYGPMLGRFDICLLELSEGEMSQGDELVDRVVPLMKQGGRIIVFVRNRRGMDTARQFSEGVTVHGSRFIRSGALPTEIQFIRACRLRWMLNRRMINLRIMSERGPAISIPATILQGGILLLLSLIASADVLRPTRHSAPRGIVSSVVMRLSVDAPKIANLNVHHYSRYEIERRKRLRSRVLPRSADGPGSLVPVASEQTRDPQYNRCLELKNQIGLTSLGLMTNEVWHDDPRRLTFLLARYKFVARMLSGRHDIGEVGCGDAFGTRVVMQEVPDVTVYDFDPVFIDDVRSRYDERWPLKAEIHDIVVAPLPRRHDGLFCLDLLEHIAPGDEHAFLANMRGSVAQEGVFIIGTPSAESQVYASPDSRAGRENCKSGNELKVLLDNYFTRVFMFSMNDEVVHTGFSPLADYLFALCTGPK